MSGSAPGPRTDRIDDDRTDPDRRTGSAATNPSTTLPALVLGLVSTVLCAVGSWHVSFWKDEADSLAASTRGVDGLWRLVHNIDAVHGLYYLTLNGWTSLFGRSEFAARLPGAIAAGIATAGVFVVADRIAGRRVAWFAAIVFAVLPRVTWMGIEARPFAYTAAAGAWMTYLFVRACAEDTVAPRRFWIGYAVLSAVGVTVNIYVALLVVAHGVSVVVAARDRDRFRPWLLAAAGAAVLSLPVVGAALGQRGQLGDTSLGLGQMVRSVVVNQWFLGNTPTPSGQPGGSLDVHGVGDLWKPAAPLLAVVCWALVVVGVVRAWRRRDDDLLGPTRLLVPAVVLPTVVVAGYSLAVSPMYSPRYFCFAAPAVAILVGVGLDALTRRRLQVTALVAVVVLAAPVYASQRTRYGKGSDWVGVAAFVQRHKGSDEGVYFTPRYPPADGVRTVGSTSRYIATSYPAAFRGLRDVTQARTGAQDDSLTGTSRLLADSTGRLTGLRSVWVVRRLDYPAAEVRGDDRVLRDAGFRPGPTRWVGPTDTVVEYVR